MLKITTIAAATLVAVSASAFAGQVQTPANNNFYVGVLGGYGKVNEKVQGATQNKNKGFDFGVNAGYMFTQNFGAEVGYQQYAKAKFGNNIQAKNNYNIHLAGVAKMPVGANFDVFGKLGVADVHSKLEDTSANTTRPGKRSALAAFVGAGVGYNVTQNIQISTEIDATTKHKDVPAMYSANLGVSYMF